jgi:hypothetical protein
MSKPKPVPKKSRAPKETLGERVSRLAALTQAMKEPDFYHYDEEAEKAKTIKNSKALRANLLASSTPPAYPLLLCDECGRLCGWLGDPGWRHKKEYSKEPYSATTCYNCLTAYPEREPRGEKMLDDPSVESWIIGPRQTLALSKELRAFSDKRVALWKRAIYPLWAKPYKKAALKNWQRFAPDWGLPSDWAIDGPEKIEVEAPDESGLLILFLTARYNFEDGRWRRIKYHRSRAYIETPPTVFSASLPMEQLASAWVDFKEAVSKDNERDWDSHNEYVLRQAQASEIEKATKELEASKKRVEKGTVDLF